MSQIFEMVTWKNPFLVKVTSGAARGLGFPRLFFQPWKSEIPSYFEDWLDLSAVSADKESKS